MFNLLEKKRIELNRIEKPKGKVSEKETGKRRSSFK